MPRHGTIPKVGPLVLRARKAFQAGKFDESKALALASIKASKAKKDGLNHAEALSVLSDVLRDSKDTKGAVAAMEEAIGIADKFKLLYTLCDTIRKRAFLYLVQADYTNADAYARKALRIARENSFGAHEADALAMIGHLCEVRKERPRALVWFREAMKAAKAANHVWRESGLHHDLGRINGELQNYAVGLDYLDKGEVFATKHGFKKHILLIWRAKADIYEAIGDTGKARELFHRSFAPAMKAGTPFEVMENSVRLGRINLADGRVDEALAHYRKGIALAKKFEYGRTILQNTFGLGRCYATQGEYVKAYFCFAWLLKSARADCTNNLSTIRSAMEQAIYLLNKLDRCELARQADELERRFKNLDDEGTYTVPQKDAMRSELITLLPRLIEDLCNVRFEIYQSQSLLVNVASGKITVKGHLKEVPLKGSELVVFRYLFSRIGQECTVEEIHNAYAGEDVYAESMKHRVHQLITAIRKKGIPKSVLQTKPGHRYCLAPADELVISENFPE